MNHLTWILAGLLISACSAQISKRQTLAPDYDERTNLNNGGEVYDPDPLLYLNLGGHPGVDFPMLRKIPKTSFSCRNVKASGYYADMETNCQVFHLCENGRKMSFLCPNGTIFRQSRLTCDWWYKVDCGASQEFYESSAEQLRLDRATPQRTNRPRPLNLDDNPNPTISSRRANSLESQEVAETGSLIINRAKSLRISSNNIVNSSNDSQNALPYSTDKPSYELRRPRPVTTTATYGLKKSIYVPTIPPIESTTQTRTAAFATTTTTISSTTEVPTTTFEPTTFADFEPRNGNREKEALEGSHSSWFNAPNTQAPITDTETTIPEQVNSLRRSDDGRVHSRAGLVDVPLSASPQTLHSLATFFAADNKTREELGKMVPEETLKMMNSIMREQKQLNPGLNTFNPDLRQLAKVFSKALSDYLHDPEGFRKTLDAIHPTQPPPAVLSNSLVDDEKDEVLDFSDAPLNKPLRTITTTTEIPQTTFSSNAPTTSNAVQSTTPFALTTDKKNDVATKVNLIQDLPQGRRVPDEVFVTPSGLFSSPESDSRIYLPSTPDAVNLVDPIPTPTASPIEPERIPFDLPEFYPHTRDYVEIGYQPLRSPTGRSFIETGPGADFIQPQYDLGPFVPSDLNSLSVFNIETRNLSPTQAPVSVSVHIPKGVDHRVTIFSSPQINNGPQPPSAPSNLRPMISKLLFPALPSAGESLVSAGTASFPVNFRNAKSMELFQKSTVDPPSKIVSETIPTPKLPATTVEPITEFIPSTTTEFPTTTFVTTIDDSLVPRARKIDDSESEKSKVVLLLVKNGATTPSPSTPYISKTMLIEALLRSQSKEQEVPKTGVHYAAVQTTTPVSTTNPTRAPDATTYKSAKHSEILRKIEAEIKERERLSLSSTEPLPQARSLVEDSAVQGRSGKGANSLHHSDSRALEILKSLYSLATRWG